MHRVFDRVVDNGLVLRTVFQMIRSGQFKNKAGKGRVGLSSSVQRAFQRWLNTALVGKQLSASIGNDPSMRDILRIARPTPKDGAIRPALDGNGPPTPDRRWHTGQRGRYRSGIRGRCSYSRYKSRPPARSGSLRCPQDPAKTTPSRSAVRDAWLCIRPRPNPLENLSLNCKPRIHSRLDSVTGAGKHILNLHPRFAASRDVSNSPISNGK